MSTDLDQINAKRVRVVDSKPSADGVSIYAPSSTEAGISIAGTQVASFRNFANAASPRCTHTGGTPVKASTDGTDVTPAVTEEFVCEVFVQQPMRITGLALFNGSAVGGNVVVALYNKAGTKVANSALAGTAQAGTDTLQRIPFTGTYDALPGTYYVGVQFDSTSARVNCHPIGNFGTTKKTGQTFGTITALTPPTTFTASVGPMGSLY